MLVFAMFNTRYITSLSGQALVSGFHFALNLVLLREIEPYDYGLFALSFVLAFFAAAINNALLATPLTVYTPVIKNSQQRYDQEALFFTMNLIYLLLVCAVGVVFALSMDLALITALGSTAFIASYSARQFSRSFGYARLKPLVPATGDLVYVLCSAIAAFGLLVLTDAPSSADLLLALATANMLAAIIEIRALEHAGHLLRQIRRLKDYKAIWLQSRWALLGGVTTLFMAQAHSIIVSAGHGPTVYAPLAAGFVLFGPVRVMFTSWQNMVKPELAVMLAEKQAQKAIRRISSVSLLMGGAVIALSIALWAGWSYIHDTLYAKKYADAPMGFIVSAWALISFCAAIRNAPAAVMQALTEFRILAIGTMYGALMSGALVFIAAYFYAPATTLYGLLAAEVFMTVYIIKTAGSRLRMIAQ